MSIKKTALTSKVQRQAARAFVVGAAVCVALAVSGIAAVADVDGARLGEQQVSRSGDETAHTDWIDIMNAEDLGHWMLGRRV